MSSNRNFAKVFKAFASQYKIPNKIEEISLYNFLLFCQETLVKKSKTLTWEDKSSSQNSNWGKLVKEDPKTVLEKYKVNVITFSIGFLSTMIEHNVIIFQVIDYSDY
ncbi:1574_t:CDS:2 [Gigaspora margarita]|uniref:1574_t:CDS:1 n=1 Tax=Gigaspora margarita TaxID=4874 RepID=A0ABN7V4C0_GIGMA|nr:1574_t:CDS:2 [Gigaspora margarita]